jgi:hypothetical protein
MDNDTFDAPYSLVEGDLFHTDSKGNRKRICHKGGAMAIAYDAEDGVLHSHGEYNDVSAWFEGTKGRLMRTPATTGLADALTLVRMPLQEDCVREVNRCVAVTGAVMGIEGRLSALYGAGDLVGTGDSGANFNKVWKPIVATTM